MRWPDRAKSTARPAQTLAGPPGVAVRQGAAKPDITTVDAFKRSLFAARSLVRSKEGTSGLYFEALLDRLASPTPCATR